MNSNAGEPPVRVLAPEGHPVEPGARSAPMRGWLVSISALVGLLALFFVLTRPSETATGTTTTTQAPPIAAVAPETLDFRTVSESPFTHGWRAAPFDGAAAVNDLIYADGIYLAGGATGGRAGVWWSRDGWTWNAATIERPEEPSGIQHMVPWHDGFVALGSDKTINNQAGVWTGSPRAESWEYHGTFPADSGPAVGLAAGQQLLAITGGETGLTGWRSPDGVEWTRFELTGLTEAQLAGITSDGDAFYAYGSSQDDVGPLSSIYRSEDGVTWQVVMQAANPSHSTVRDIVVADGRMVAVGYDPYGESQSIISLWETTDGVEWERIVVGDPAISAPQSVSFTVIETNPGDNPTADLQVGTTTVKVTDGTTLDTDFGSVVVEDIVDNGIEIRGDGLSEFLATRRTYLYPGNFVATKVAVEGPRIAVAGEAYGMSEPQPIIWTSLDSGATWKRDVLPPSGAGSVEIATHGSTVTLIGSSSDTTSAWQARWDTGPLEATAVGLLSEFVNALGAHDTDAVLRVLPAHVGALTAFEVPSLGHEDPGWWDGGGNLDVDRVGDTVDYLAATNTAVAIDDCETTVTLGSSDRTDVVCLYTVNSDLLRLFGVVDGSGRLAATIRDGALLEVSIDSSPPEIMWNALAPGLVADSPEGITFSAATAREHLDGARLYLEGLLEPGETTIVDTALGTMEWTWIEPDELSPGHESSVVWSQLGFTWFGSRDSATMGIEPFVYNSTDGTTWEAASVPDRATGLLRLHAFQDGLIGSMWNNDGIELTFFDGSTWASIPVPVEDPARAYFSVTAGTDTALLHVSEWSDDGIAATDAVYMIDSELNLTGAAEPPATADSPYAYVQFAPSDRGFIAIVTDMGTGSISVWVTDTGQEWTLLTEKLVLDNVDLIWSLQGHSGQYFVVGEGAELRCTDTSLGDECGFWLTVWDSPDGTDWHELRTTDGRLVTTSQIASGPLGLAAFGARSPAGSASAVYISADGDEWEEVEHLALINTAGASWWGSAPAVGTDTIVLVGTIYRQRPTLDPDTYEVAEDSEQTFMIVGRLVDQ